MKYLALDQQKKPRPLLFDTEGIQQAIAKASIELQHKSGTEMLLEIAEEYKEKKRCSTCKET